MIDDAGDDVDADDDVDGDNDDEEKLYESTLLER